MPTTQSMDALLNEYKGSLFEFLVSKSLAQTFDIEQSFLESLTTEQIGMLSQQEKYLRNEYLDLLNSLPLIAAQCSETIENKIALTDINSIQLMGMNAKSHSEADLLLINSGESIPISLKLSKTGSFTNTKSAGVKSFLSKYFNYDQTNFNNFYDNEFSSFAYNMYREAGEELSEDFSHWEGIGLPNLPGKLEGSFRVLLLEFYEKINLEIFNILEQIYSESPISFVDSLIPLAGFSSENLIQVTSYYKKNEDKYCPEKTEVNRLSNFGIAKNMDIKLKKSANNIKISGEKFSLLIRLKPMNKFTHKSYKINCALKFN